MKKKTKGCNRVRRWSGYLMGVLFCLCMLGFAGCSTGQSQQQDSADATAQSEADTASTDCAQDADTSQGEDGLKVHFIDVGQGDSILITCAGHAMMIDFGNNDKGTLVQKYVQDQGITSLDYAIGTHPDADHIGGMDVLLYKLDVSRVLMPDVSNDTATYRDVLDTCSEEGYTIETPVVGETYTLGGATFQIIAPCSDSYSDINSYSIGIRLVYGDNSFVLCGDATIESEQEMLASGETLQADVLKLSHHGSSTATSEAFLEAVDPQYAVVSCGLGNSYGHPHKEVMSLLQEKNISLFRTDLQGTLVAASDGTTITWNTEATTDYSSGEELSGTAASSEDEEDAVTAFSSDVQTSEDSQDETTYVVNTNTKKFHLPSCSSVSQMKEENKQYVTDTEAELEAEGYTPCQNCIGN